jgi:hypothetical protein
MKLLITAGITQDGRWRAVAAAVFDQSVGARVNIRTITIVMAVAGTIEGGITDLVSQPRRINARNAIACRYLSRRTERRAIAHIVEEGHAVEGPITNSITVTIDVGTPAITVHYLTKRTGVWFDVTIPLIKLIETTGEVFITDVVTEPGAIDTRLLIASRNQTFSAFPAHLQLAVTGVPLKLVAVQVLVAPTVSKPQGGRTSTKTVEQLTGRTEDSCVSIVAVATIIESGGTIEGLVTITILIPAFWRTAAVTVSYLPRGTGKNESRIGWAIAIVVVELKAVQRPIT